MKSLTVTEIQCEKCHEDFDNKEDLERHVKNKHSIQWNCEQCAFQASTRYILMNHCKLTPGHQPSKQRQRLGQTGALECYTCKSEFRNYYDLMNHRKQEHPSHKKCRYYLKGECNFSASECWYLHEERSATETNIEDMCDKCNMVFSSYHKLTEHKKREHLNRNLNISKTTTERGTNSNPSSFAQPLPSVWQGDFQQAPPAAATDQKALMMALTQLNQKMEIINSMSQRLQAIEKQIFPNIR